jgi:carboxypeptidase Taq
MRPVLSPAETLGLSGSALDARIRRAAHHVSDAVFARIAERLRADAWANKMIYERDAQQEAVRVMLRPLLAMRDQLAYVHHVCLQLTEALKRFPALAFEDARFRRILAVTEDEERWFRDTWVADHQRVNPVYGRLDAVCDFTAQAWRDSLQFMEPNLSGVGGIHFSPLAEQLVMRDVVPTLAAHDPGLAMELLQDQRELFLQVLMDHARAVGRETSQLAFVEPKYIHEGPDEQAVLREYLQARHGVTIAHADPRELHVDGDEVFYEDIRIDVAYRDYEARELVHLERELGKPLEAMRLLFRQNRVVSSIVGDFDHKSCFEILTDPELTSELFTIEEARLFRRHVLWTRVVAERRTTLPRGNQGDLIEYARSHRELLVLKPNRGYGGTGVVLGAAVDTGEWERLLNEALGRAADPERSYVLQLATRLPVYEFPVVGADGRVFGEPYYSVMGFAATENGLGILCRVSQKQVVNVAQRGGLAAVLVTDTPPDLRIPKRSLSSVADLTQSLREEIAEIRHLDHTIALLGWDEETMLPQSARAERGAQLATLEGLRHARLVSDRLGDLVEEVAQQNETDADRMREIALLRRQRRQALALPEDLVRHFANARSQSLGAWEEARVKNDFTVFAGPFEKLVALSCERAKALDPGTGPYDALLDEYEPGLTRGRLEPVLAEVRTRLVPIVQEAAEATAWPAGVALGVFPAPAQWELCRGVLAAIGFDFERGRLDRSTHPFTLLAGINDVRLTVRVHEDDLTAGVLAALHEGGHGLYDQGFDPEDRDSLLGEAPSMGLHESQSRLWENHVGRSREFWHRLAPRLRALFPEVMTRLDADSFWRAVNRVSPGVNRVNADEMSYHLHILLRYELEIALLAGELSVRDLPAAWRARSAELLGVTPESDREGVLQDVHWSLGSFGYFPTYTLGSLYSAQFAEAYAKHHPLAGEIREGAFGGLLGWLRQNVHRFGYRYPAEELVARATGEGLDAAAFFRHLGDRIAAAREAD